MQVREFSTGAEMIQHYAAVHRRLTTTRPKPSPRPLTGARRCYRSPIGPRRPTRADIIAASICTLADMAPPERGPKLSTIIDVVANRFNIPKAAILSHRREKTLVRARHIIMYLTAELTTMSLAEIGRRMDRDHSTVVHGVWKVRRHIKKYEAAIRTLRRDLASPPNP